MSASIISYPVNFTARPADRDLIDRLQAVGLSADTAEVMLYRIWKEFATSGSDRRRFDADASRVTSLLERFCNWQGTQGELVNLAIAADFLNVEEGGGDERFLVCRDFFPINSRFAGGGNSMQKRGAYTRVLNRVDSQATSEATKHAELWERAGSPGLQDFTPERREAALIFVHKVCRAAEKSIPKDSELRGGLVRAALKCLDAHTDDEIRDTLLYIISRRRDPLLPATAASIINGWPALAEKAKQEGI